MYDSEGYVGTVKDAPPYNTTQLQTIAYDDDTQTPAFTRTYTDRRGNEWVYTFDTSDNNLIEFEDALNHVDSWTYDADQNKLTYTNNLNKTWEYEWDSTANLLSVTNPLGQKTEWTFNSLNQVTSITPALNSSGDVNTNKTVEYFYDDSLNPTKVTEIQEPSTPSGGDPISTYLSYYGHTGNYPEWKGLLEQVIDPNGVTTIFGYDDYGQLAEEDEGFGSPGPGGDGYTQNDYGSNAGGVTVYASSGFGSGSMSYNLNGWPGSSGCVDSQIASTDPNEPILWPDFPTTCTNPSEPAFGRRRLDV